MSEESNNNRLHPTQVLLNNENELILFCRSESISEEGICEIIERHGLAANNNRIRKYKSFRSACNNERVTEGIMRCLLGYFPAAISDTDDDGRSPFHVACNNKNVTLNIIQLLIDAAPDSVRSVDDNGGMPLHWLCGNKTIDEAVAVQICKLLIEKHPEAVRHADNEGRLPIHFASGRRSPEFCHVLIEAFPGSEQITTRGGALPLHYACRNNSLATVDYLYKVYPDAIHRTTAGGNYPIHYSIQGMKRRGYRRGLYPIYVLEIVQFLLNCDPNQKIIKFRRKSLLQCACEWMCSKASIEAAIQVIKVIFDAHPEAIEDERIATNIHRYHLQVQAFINEHLVLARQAKDHRLMTTPDTNGQLPLHRALQNNAMLGLIKLLVKGNPAAVLFRDISGALPVHIACQHHDSASVIQYLLSLDATILDAVDRQWNTALHHACRGAKYETIAMLLEKYDAASVSKRNAAGKLPIDLLWESNEVSDRESVEYMGSVFQLVRAYPEMTMISNT